MLDLRMACLAQGRADFEAVVEVLANANADVLARAREIVAGLRRPRACADAVALTADVAPPDDLDARVRVEAARGELARALALRIANRHDDALAIVEEVAASVHDMDYAPLDTDIAVARGTLLDRVGRVGPAEEETRRALRLALEHGQWTQALAAVEELVRALGMRARTDEALAFLEVGWGLLQRRGFGAEDEARLRASHSSVLLEAARFDEAKAELRRAIELTIEAHGPESPEEADRRTSLAGVLFRSNGYAEAAEESTKAIAILTSAFGPEHPRLVAAINNLANALWLQGDFAGAEARAREALRIAQDAFGEDHIDVALAEATMGVVLTQAGKLVDAEPHLRRSLAIRLEHLGADDPQVGRTHNSLAVMLTRSGRHAEAEEHLREVVRSDVARLGPDHPHLVRIRYTLANALLHQGKTAEARREYELATQLAVRSTGTETRDVDHGETVLFDLLIAEGALADAEALARRRRDAQAGDPEQYAIRSKALALVLMARGRRVEAAAVLELAVASLAAHRPPEDAALVRLRIDLGIAAGEIGDWQRAYESYSAAYASEIRTRFPPHLQAVLVFELARALDHLHREPDRARALAEEALALWRPHSDETAVAEIAVIEDWLARHPARGRGRRER
jgi:tetratricopeptide (TPR) repeat protein